MGEVVPGGDPVLEVNAACRSARQSGIIPGMEPPDRLERARSLLSEAKRLVIFTGAGVSADSGVPTFRGTSDNALWGKHDSRQLASPEGFRRDPELVYGWYTWRRSQLASVRPNAGHNAIAALQRRGAVVITQNVDGLHEAVAPPGAVIHRLHGTLAEDRCSACDYRQPVSFDALPPLRPCPRCAALLRPAVVWFGEALDPHVWRAAAHAAANADVMLAVGTSGEVYPAAGLVQLASDNGARVILVNLEPGALDQTADVVLHGRAAGILPLLLG